MKETLASLCSRLFGNGQNGGVEPENVRRLTSGASMESWSFDCVGRGYILRRLPGSAGADDIPAPQSGIIGRIPVSAEAAVIAAAGEAGVRAPKIAGVLEPGDGLGEGFVMERVAGEALPQRLFKDPAYEKALGGLVEEFAGELSRIHRIDPEAISPGLPVQSTSEMIEALKSQYHGYGAQIPIFDYAFRWLKNRMPPAVQPVVLHGDFRLGNILVGTDGLTSVLDWEIAHLGDPAQDLAYLCAPAWRFGRYQKPVAGLGEIDELLRAYKDQSGREIERERFDFWLVYGALWWGIACLSMTDIWRSGVDRSLERVVIGTRVSEVEMDLLLLLEEEAGEAAREDVFIAAPIGMAPDGETQVNELLTALQDWVREDVQDGASGKALFNARVAGNALGIIERRLATQEGYNAAASDRLKALGLSHQSLCETLATGDTDLATPGVLAHLRACTLERLSVDQPRYAGLHVARTKWGIA